MKTGDRVRVIDDVGAGPNAGREGVVYDVADDGDLKVQLDGDEAGAWWPTSLLEPTPPMGSRDPILGPKYEWARAMVLRAATLFHPGTFAVGVAEHAWSGAEGDVYFDPNEQAVWAPVVKLSTGHALLADPAVFVELSPREAEFYAEAVDRLGGLVLGGAQAAASKGIPEPTAMLLLAATLRAQLAALGGAASSGA